MSNASPPADAPSEQVLTECPGRALTFLRGLTMNPGIHGLLASAGYTAADHQEGWTLLFDAAGYTPGAPVAPAIPANDAMQELDAWDEDGFRRVGAALERLHPDQHAFVFAGDLKASVGSEAVIGVKTLLDRLDALENGKDRKATRTADHRALATLEQRGMTKDERNRLRALVDQAKDLGDAPVLVAPALDAKKHAEALRKLYAWFKDWSNTARAVVKKRAYLITLGLAKRKSPPKKGEAPPA